MLLNLSLSFSFTPLGVQVSHKGLTKKGNGKWQVQIWLNGKSRYVGVYNTVAIASSAYHLAMNFMSLKLVTKFDQLSPQDVRADISALKDFVNKSLKTLSTTTDDCSNHQDMSKGDAGLPVQVGRTNTVSSLGLAMGVQGLPVQVGRTNTVSSPGLAKRVHSNPLSTQVSLCYSCSLQMSERIVRRILVVQ